MPASSVSLRSVGVVTFFSFGQLALLFVLQLMLASVFGTSAELDAYLSAFALPLLLGGVVGTALSGCLIPIYNQQREARGDDAAEASLGRVGFWVGIGCVVVAWGLSFFGEAVVSICFPEFDAPTTRLTVRVHQILIWLVPVNTLTAFLYGIEHARQRFFFPALVGIIGPLVTVLLFWFALPHTVESLAWATLTGGLIGGLLLAPRFPKPREAWHLPDRDLSSRVGRMATPLLLGASYARLDVLVDRTLASGLPEGNISGMGYASRIVAAVFALAVNGLSVVIFPSLSKHASAGDMDQVRADLAEGFRLLATILVPVVASLYFCGGFIISALLERGEFTARDAEFVATLVNCALLMLVGTSIGEILARTFFSLHYTWTPTILGIVGFTLGVVGKFLVVDRFGAYGLVLMTSAATCISVVMFLIVMHRIGVPACYQGLLGTLARVSCCSAVAVAVAVWWMSGGTPVKVLLGVPLAVGVYLLLLFVSGDEYVRRAVHALRSLTGFDRKSPPES